MYVGPYKIIRKLSDLSFEIRKSIKDKPLIVHVDKLKKCVSRDDVISDVATNVVSHCSLQNSCNEEMADKEKNFGCSICGNTFRRKFDINRHHEMNHFKIKQNCAQCGVVLGSIGSLRRHLKDQHGIKMTTRPEYRPSVVRMMSANPGLQETDRRNDSKVPEPVITVQDCRRMNKEPVKVMTQSVQEPVDRNIEEAPVARGVEEDLVAWGAEEESVDRNVDLESVARNVDKGSVDNDISEKQTKFNP